MSVLHCRCPFRTTLVIFDATRRLMQSQHSRDLPIAPDGRGAQGGRKGRANPSALVAYWLVSWSCWLPRCRSFTGALSTPNLAGWANASGLVRLGRVSADICGHVSLDSAVQSLDSTVDSTRCSVWLA